MQLRYDDARRQIRVFFTHPPTVTFIFLLVILLELEESVQRAPTIRLLENAICQRYYRSDGPPGPIDERMCKEEPIQVELAYVRGLLSFFDSLPCKYPIPRRYLRETVTNGWIVILFGSVIGSIADHYGRRTSFALAVLGTLCGQGWIYLTCESALSASQSKH